MEAALGVKPMMRTGQTLGPEYRKCRQTATPKNTLIQTQGRNACSVALTQLI